MRYVVSGRPRRVKVLAALAIGTVGGVIVGGAVHLIGTHGSNAADAAAGATPTVSVPVSIPTAGAPVPAGSVVADQAAADLSGPPPRGTVRTPDGAAAAFTAYAIWLVGSAAAANDPAHAPAAVGSTLLDPTDARLLADMQRAPGDGFDADHGAYRILGQAGSANAPEEVMVQVTAPLTVDAKTRWSTVGGVVTWTATGWQLTSIKPTNVHQPSIGRKDVHEFTAKERASTFAGLGWHTFAPARR